MRNHFGYACKFAPTCSCYSKEAYKIHGWMKGSFLSLCRILKCHPFNQGGYDPVPTKRELKHG